MRPNINVKGLGLQINVSSVMVTEYENDEYLHLDKQPDGTWQLTLSSNIAPFTKDRLKCISFDQFEKAKEPCYTVWRGTGWIKTVKEAFEHEYLNDGEQFIHLDKNGDSNLWALHVRGESNGRPFVARKITHIEFDWSHYR